MNPGYSIRLATIADLPLLPQIEIAAAGLFPEADLPRHLRYMAKEKSTLRKAIEGQRLWVACDEGGTPVGFALADEVGGLAYLEEIDVHPAHMRRGLGKQLIAAVIRWATQGGYPVLRLVTFSHLPWNAPYYASQGFVTLDPESIGPDYQQLIDEDADVGIDPVNRVVMELRLDSAD
jgi:GNAT superfamily N-acetyltransferase